MSAWVPFIACMGGAVLLMVGGVKGLYGGEPGKIDTRADEVVAVVWVILVMLALLSIL